MKYPADIKGALARRYESRLPDWLIDASSANVELSLAAPSEKVAIKNVAGVADWVAAWQRVANHWPVIFEERAWRQSGRQLLPVRIRVESAERIALLAGKEADWQRWQRRIAAIVRQAHNKSEEFYCEVIAALMGRRADIRQLANADWDRALAAATWVVRNPDSGLRVRALPVAGMDTKWVERHLWVITLVTSLLRSGLDLPGGSNLGLAPLHDPTFDFVFTDPAQRPGGLRALALPRSTLQTMAPPRGVLVLCENKQTAMAVGDRPGVTVIHSAGQRAAKLADIPWFLDLPVVYWGDLDTYGFQILAGLRRIHPRITTALMDAETLAQFSELWVPEPKSARPGFEQALLADERAVLAQLRASAPEFGGNAIRLEQERISWAWAKPRLAAAVAIAAAR